ncbi:MAG: right-handed parallel beta-helix repeat-containing protein [Chloroflexota bacterium]
MQLFGQDDIGQKYFILSLLVLGLSGVLSFGFNTVAEATGNTTYYVAPNGNDNHSGSESEPLQTIQTAINKAIAGDTIYVRGGIYHEEIRVTQSGTAQNPIRILAYEGELPVIDGEYSLPAGEAVNCSSMSPFHCFVYTPLVLLRASHIEFSGFKIVRSRGRGIGVASTTGSTTRDVLIDSCQVDGTRHASVNILDAEQIMLQNCDISHGADFAPYSRSSAELNWPVIVNVVRSDQVTIRRNKIHESWGEGVAAGRDSTNVTIEDNIIYDNYALQVYLHRSQDVILQRNLVYHSNAAPFHRGENPSECIVVNNESAFPTSLSTARIKIRNNVVTGCSRGISIWGNAGTDVLTTDIEVAHNITANSVRNDGNEPMGIYVHARVPLQNITITKNIVLQEDGIVASVPLNDQIDVDANLWSSLPTLGASSASDYVGDPELSNPYRALNAGYVQVDWFKPKVSSSAIQLEIGPFEYLEQAALDEPAVELPQLTPTQTDKPTLVPTSTQTPAQTDEPTLVPTPTQTPTLTDITTLVPQPTQTPAPETNNAPVDLSNPLIHYRFNGASGDSVQDDANHPGPLNLTIGDSTAVHWSEDGLTILEPVMIHSVSPATKLIDGCRSTNELSLLLWITPANSSQNGPARLISLSSDTTNRNFMIGQGLWGDLPTDLYHARLRTTETDNNGEPALNSDQGVVRTASRTHLVYTRKDNGEVKFYVNGTSTASGIVGGTFSNWDSNYTLHLANEASGERPWLGTYHEIAIFCHSLTANEVNELYTLSTVPPTERPNDPSGEPDFLSEIFLPIVN